MYGSLHFDLPEESDDFDRARKASALCCAVTEFDNLLRSWVKHGLPDDVPAEHVDTVQKIRALLHSCLDEFEVGGIVT